MEEYKLMNIQVLNQNFEIVAVISEYESFIWTDRYNKPGDFELYSPIDSDTLQYLVRDNYIRLDTSDHLMIIEDIIYQSDVDSSGSHVQVKGRSLESILDRRIIWGKKDVSGNMQDVVIDILNDCIINPEMDERKIDNFIFERNVDTKIEEITVTNQYDGTNLLSIIEDIAEEYDIGWKIILNDNNQFVFSFYLGVDRSYDQSENPYVVFSPEYEDIINSTYTEEGNKLKNVVLVAGDYNATNYDVSDGNLSMSEREPVYRVIGTTEGLQRRETYTKESGVKQDEGMSYEEYLAKLDQVGTEELIKNRIEKKFDGQYETNLVFKYGTDFFIGDSVEVADQFGNRASSKVIEFIWSNNVSGGEEAYPTFRTNDITEEQEV